LARRIILSRRKTSPRGLVVDPERGDGKTERRTASVSAQRTRILVRRTDNGVLYRHLSRKRNMIVRQCERGALFLQPVSKTFMGRDIFAPVARMATKGWRLQQGERSRFKRFALPRPKRA